MPNSRAWRRRAGRSAGSEIYLSVEARWWDAPSRGPRCELKRRKHLLVRTQPTPIGFRQLSCRQYHPKPSSCAPDKTSPRLVTNGNPLKTACLKNGGVGALVFKVFTAALLSLVAGIKAVEFDTLAAFIQKARFSPNPISGARAVPGEDLIEPFLAIVADPNLHDLPETRLDPGLDKLRSMVGPYNHAWSWQDFLEKES
jgi:hypothetical protein